MKRLWQAVRFYFDAHARSRRNWAAYVGADGQLRALRRNHKVVQEDRERALRDLEALRAWTDESAAIVVAILELRTAGFVYIPSGANDLPITIEAGATPGRYTGATLREALGSALLAKRQNAVAASAR